MVSVSDTDDTVLALAVVLDGLAPHAGEREETACNNVTGSMDVVTR